MVTEIVENIGKSRNKGLFLHYQKWGWNSYCHPEKVAFVEVPVEYTFDCTTIDV